MSDPIIVETEETTATPPVLAPAPAQPDAQKTGDAFDKIDYDRLAAGDEEYAKEVNASLADAPIPSEAPAADPAEAKESVPVPAPKDDEFYVFDDGDPVYKGQAFKVKKAELKQFVQKGRHMDQALREVAPLRRLTKESPEFAALLDAVSKDPEKAAEFKAALKAAVAAKDAPEDDLSDLKVDGLHPDDVKNVAKVNKAIRERELGKVKELTAKQLREQDAKQAEKDMTARAYVHALRTHEGEVFDQVRPHMKALMEDAEREAPPEVFERFKAMVTNPFVTDKNGTPIFHKFYQEAKTRMLRSQGKPAAELAAPRAQAAQARSVPLKAAPTNSARLQPGSAEASASSAGSGQPNWAAMSQSEFDRRMNEALQRAN